MINRQINFGKPHVLVIGDVMIDRYMIGKSTRKSPEADVPVLEDYTVEDRLGGAANVALSCVGLGATTSLLSISGNDEYAPLLRDLLRDTDIHTLQLVDKDRKTTIKTRVMHGSQHLLRVDHEDRSPFPHIKRLRSACEAIHQERPIDVVILQDYNKGLLHADSIKQILTFCKANHIMVTVDPKVQHHNSYVEVDLIKPNRHELESMLQVSIENIEEALVAAETLRKALDCQMVACTLGAEGMILCDESGATSYPAKTIDVVDVCGAGDAVISAMTLALYAGWSSGQVAEIGNIAGAVACSISGVSPIKIDQLASN